MSTWKETWLDNYYNRSVAAKDIDNLMKKNYKGHNYVPWATMVRWLYLMDENAELDVDVHNDDTNGNIVFTDMIKIEQHVTENKQTVKDDARTESYKSEQSEVDAFAHFVRVRCTFLGKTFIENYPIQDNAYNAPKYYDSNMVNKSIQRAKAKIISIATGLGYQLYESGDLQFEDDTKEVTKSNLKVVKQEVPKKTEQVEEVKKEVKETAAKETSGTPEIDKIIGLIRTHGDASLPILQAINPSLVKTYSFSLTLKDSDEELRKKLSGINNLKIFANMVEKRFEKLTKETA